MRIGVPKEIKKQEHRIGLTPDSVKTLTNKGHEVFVEKNGLPNPESSINRLTQLLVSGLEKHPQSVA